MNQLTCPHCSGPHTLSQCPTWRQPPHILAAASWDNRSIEAQFHKRIRQYLTKRQQGWVMGAFRDCFKPQPEGETK